MDATWIRTEDRVPEQLQIVETISPGGIQQRLKYVGALWFLTDGSMYVYYVPEFWRPLA